MRFYYYAILFLAFSTSGTALFGQTAGADQLYAQRRQQAAADEDYAATERAILDETGSYPKALVSTSVSEGIRSFDFRIYKTISPDKQDRIEQRLMVSVSGVQAVEIDNQRVSVHFSPGTTEESILQFFQLLGYANYEIK